MSVLDTVRVIIYRFHEKGLEIFLVNSDLENDPDELSNIYDHENAATLRKELREMIDSRPDDALPNQTQVGMA